MFRLRRGKSDPCGLPDQKQSCSFCNKTKDVVKKLIAGPAVFICDECVQVCVDIVADDAHAERAAAEQGEPVTRDVPRWAASFGCTLCRIPVVLEEALCVENRGILCRGCVGAIQAAVAKAAEVAASESKP